MAEAIYIWLLRLSLSRLRVNVQTLSRHAEADDLPQRPASHESVPYGGLNVRSGLEPVVVMISIRQDYLDKYRENAQDEFAGSVILRGISSCRNATV